MLVGGLLRRVESFARRRRQLGVVGRLDVLALGVPPGGAVAHSAGLLDEMGLYHLAGIVVDGPRPDDVLGDRPPGHQDLVALLGVALLHLEQPEPREIDRQIFSGLVVLGHDGAAHRQHADGGDEVALVGQLLFGHRRRERKRRRDKEREQQEKRGTKHGNSLWPGRGRGTTWWTGSSSRANPKLLVWPLTKSPTTRGTTHGEHLPLHRADPRRERPRCRRSHQGAQPRQLQIRQCGGVVLRQAGGAARLLDARGRDQGGARGIAQGRGRGADQRHRRGEAGATLIVGWATVSPLPARTVGTLRLAHPTHQSRSTRPFTPSCLAQWTQQ